MAKASRKRSAPFGGERLLPKERGDSLRVLRFEARRLFLDALAEECPHLLGSLWREVFVPHFALPGYSGLDDAGGVIGRWLDRFRFRKVTRAGPGRWRYEYVEWFSNAVWDTLWAWKSLPELNDSTHERARPGRLEFRDRIFGRGMVLKRPRQLLDAVVLPGRFRYKEEPYRSWLVKGYILHYEYLKRHPKPGVLPRDEDYETILVPERVRPFEFSFPAFEPFEERTADWQKRCRAAFDQAVKTHLGERDPGGKKAPKLTELDHFRWAALAMCGDNGDVTFGWTFARVAAAAGRTVSEKTVQSAVARVLRIVGLRLPERRGRKRGIAERHGRHLAEKD